MVFSPWFIVEVVLFAILFVLFMAFIMWLAHTLEGYPMFLIQNQDRGTGVVPRSLRLGPVPESSPVLSAFRDSSGVRARDKQDETMGHHAGLL
jgi:hypothetical protein